MIASYGMSLILASILDTLALKPVQAVAVGLWREIADRFLGLQDVIVPGVREAGDPYYNVNLDQASGYCQVKRG